MNISVTGTDKRFEYLKDILTLQGYAVTDGEPELIVANYPSDLPPKAGVPVVTCGPKSSPDARLDLMKDEDYQRDIAYMTAEGAVASAMISIPRAMRGAKCMVIGWGRIGRALAEILTKLGAEVTVLTRRQDAMAEIARVGAIPAHTGDAGALLPGMHVVFSTPPAMVLDAEALKRADITTAIIDLASPPYGVDLEASRERGLHAWREPALPGRYCPETAARAIYAALERGGVLHG